LGKEAQASAWRNVQYGRLYSAAMTKPSLRKRLARTLPSAAKRVDPRWVWHHQTLMALRNHLLQQKASPETSDDFDREFVRALLARESNALGEINAALRRIADGTYGICERSGRLIDPRRLRALPWTRDCGD
jgi:RNA polymerase-binding transcription factor DksA